MALSASWLLQIVPPIPRHVAMCVNSSRARLGWLKLLACAAAHTVLPGSGVGLGRLVALAFRLPVLTVGIFPVAPFAGLRVFPGLRR